MPARNYFLSTSEQLQCQHKSLFMCNVSIRNKYFELIIINNFIYLFILLKINNYIQVKYTETSM